MKLFECVTPEGRLVAINPAHIVSVRVNQLNKKQTDILLIGKQIVTTTDFFGTVILSINGALS